MSNDIASAKNSARTFVEQNTPRCFRDEAAGMFHDNPVFEMELDNVAGYNVQFACSYSSNNVLVFAPFACAKVDEDEMDRDLHEFVMDGGRVSEIREALMDKLDNLA